MKVLLKRFIVAVLLMGVVMALGAAIAMADENIYFEGTFLQGSSKVTLAGDTRQTFLAWVQCPTSEKVEITPKDGRVISASTWSVLCKEQWTFHRFEQIADYRADSLDINAQTTGKIVVCDDCNPSETPPTPTPEPTPACYPGMPEDEAEVNGCSFVFLPFAVR